MGILDLVAIATPGACLFWGRAKWISARVAVICAVVVMTAIAGVVGGGWDGAVYADGGADARDKAAASASDETTPPDYARRILRALADDDANKWVRYWRARVDCDAFASHTDPTPTRSRALLALTASLCAHLDALLGVNPAAYSPRGEERTVGLLLNEPGAAAGYTLFTAHRNNSTFLIDPLGRLAHAWHMRIRIGYGTRLLDNGNLLVISDGVIVPSIVGEIKMG